MSNLRGPGAFCSIVMATLTGTSNSLASLNGFLMGEGAEAFCLQNRKTYRYTNTVITPVLPLFVAATGTGTWVEQDPAADASVGCTSLIAFSGSSLTGASATYQALPTGASFYALTIGNAIWSMNTTTGILTYSGPAGTTYVVSASLVFSAPSASGDTAFALTQNGALIGTSGFVSTKVNAGNLGTGNQQLVQQIYLNPVPGDTYQHVWLRGVGGTYFFDAFQATYTNLP